MAWRGYRVACGTRGDRPERQRRKTLETERAVERKQLWQTFCEAGVADGPAPARDNPAPFVDAAIRFVALTDSPLALLPLEDVLGSPEQPNLPGTIDQHPNWRRRTTDVIDKLLDEPAVARRIADLVTDRPRR